MCRKTLITHSLTFLPYVFFIIIFIIFLIIYSTELTQGDAKESGIAMALHHNTPTTTRGWSGVAMVLGKLQVPGRPTI